MVQFLLCSELLSQTVFSTSARIVVFITDSNSKHIDDIEVAILSKQIDVFISYRRSTGNQLASLIKVLLQLRGYKV